MDGTVWKTRHSDGVLVNARAAVVNSPNCLWLREAPGGTFLVLLPRLETVDGVEWQQVRTSAGNEGWVAVDFIIYQ